MVQVREAATVILLRDRPDLQTAQIAENTEITGVTGIAASTREPGAVAGAFEVLVLRRNPRSVFSPGASVFPGGAVDPADDAPATLARVAGGPDDLGLVGGGLRLRVAAARECFEEAGVLLARDRATGARVDPDAPERAERFAAWRAALNSGSAGWGELMAAEDLVLDARDLHVFAHFLTPVGAPRRYDTWFFVAAAPEGQEGAHDDAELVESEWMRPFDALARYERGEIELISPTQRSLQVLARFGSAADAVGAVRAVPRERGGGPAVVADGFGERVALPNDPGQTRAWTIPLTADRSIRQVVAGAPIEAVAGGGS